MQLALVMGTVSSGGYRNLLSDVIGPEVSTWYRLGQSEFLPGFFYGEPWESRNQAAINSSELESTLWTKICLYCEGIKTTGEKQRREGSHFLNKLVCFGVTVPGNADF